MSLTLPTAYSNSSKLGNIQENWIVQLGFYNGDAQGKGDGGWDAVLQSDGTANLLNEALDDSETGVDVDDGTVFQVGDYIKVQSEIMHITAISTNTLTVERGAMNTTESAHGNNYVIFWNNFTPIALSDVTVDDVFYHGVITSKPRIRTSINLWKSTAKTGNVSLSVANFKYKGDDFSAEMFLGTRKYINREVRIYSQLNSDSVLANCLQVYSGRLIDIAHDVSSMKLSIAERRPWDFVSIPQVSSDKGNYFPVIYGNYAVNSSSYASPAYSAALAKTVHPVHVDKSSFYYYPLVHEDYGSTDTTLHYFEPSLDSFIPLEDSNDAEAYGDGYSVPSKWDVKRHFKAKPIGHVGTKQWTNSANAINGTADEDESGSAATVLFGDAQSTSSPYLVTLTKTDIINLPATDDAPLLASSDASNNHGLTLEVNWKATNVYLIHNSGSTVEDNFITLSEVAGGSTFTNGTADVSANSSASVVTGSEDASSGVTVSNVTATTQLSDEYKSTGGYPDGVQLKWTRIAKGDVGDTSLTKLIDDNNANMVSVFDIRAKYTLAIDRLNDTTDGTQRISSIKTLYSGHDGFAKSFSGGSGTASTGLEAHRDLLVRFAGWDAADSSIYNWDDSYPANVDSGSDLTADIDESTGSAPVDDGTDFQIGNIIKINSEKMLITNISSNTLTVTRAYVGTTAAEHGNNDHVYIVKSSIVEDHRVTSPWNIRWWEHKPVELKKVLDRIQFEFGFLFKFRADGSGSYWVIKDNYSSDDVTQTLNQGDISGLKINNTPFSELLTKMEISYQKHPAEDRHTSNITAVDTTNKQRAIWNVQSKENVGKIELNMNVNKPGNANPGGGNPNDGFADYYMNIYGDVKKIISCDIINSSKGYSLETGDIIQFSNTAGEMPVDPFGDDWADFYCVEDLNRSPGKVSITAREVG